VIESKRLVTSELAPTVISERLCAGGGKRVVTQRAPVEKVLVSTLV
jgi:hypothetical protein